METTLEADVLGGDFCYGRRCDVVLFESRNLHYEHDSIHIYRDLIDKSRKKIEPLHSTVYEISL